MIRYFTSRIDQMAKECEFPRFYKWVLYSLIIGFLVLCITWAVVVPMGWKAQ